MKDFIKFIAIKLLRIILRIFYIIPVKNNRILFMSYGGKQYSCNPKYISDYILRRKKYDIVWVVKSKELITNENIKKVFPRTIKFYYYYMTSKYIITNGIIFKEVPLRNKQEVINTWHGGGAYKRVVYDNVSKKRNYFEKKLLKLSNKSRTIYLSSCKLATKFVIRSGLGHTQEILEIGSPRNDVLINSTALEQKEISNRIKKIYNIDIDNKILLYAPTFRDSKNNDSYDIDFDMLKKQLKIKFGGEWSIFIRMHQVIENNKLSNEFIYVNDYPDMQELLIAADVFITDYSSSIWDYSFLKKPAFLYTSDIDMYKNERNFYVDIEQWPFKYARNNEELELQVRTYNHEELLEKIEKHHEMMGSFEDGKSTEKIYQYMFGREE